MILMVTIAWYRDWDMITISPKKVADFRRLFWFYPPARLPPSRSSSTPRQSVGALLVIEAARLSSLRANVRS